MPAGGPVHARLLLTVRDQARAGYPVRDSNARGGSVTPQTVLIADGNERLAQLLGQLLADEPDLALLGVCTSAEPALARAAQGRPDVVLLSERLDGHLTGTVITALREAAPQAAVLLWSHDPDTAAAVEGEDAPDGVLDRGMTFRELIRAVRKATPVAPAGASRRPRRLWAPDEAPVAETPPAPAEEGEVEGHLVLRCESCRVRDDIATADMPVAVDAARAFFAEHADCATSIDLTEQRHRPYVA